MSQNRPCHPSFEFINSENISSLNLDVEIYRHRVTGAMHYHLSSDNDENVFLVALRTIPTDSTGVAHILEHTALCGSEKYPVRDPFFMMIRRSLNTFMNAFTSSDWTAYPFASQNKKDFNNLLDVYLDAVFFSRLHELDFAQEGHRVEFEQKDNKETDLVYKGVVFNEMKGAMSSTVSTVWHTMCKYLFPASTYHFNSGGEPDDIPDLSYEQLKAFYKTHYHPSNAIFMTFGNIPAIDHQNKFESQVLSRFEYLGTEISVNNEKRYYSPICVEEAYSYDEKEDEESDEKGNSDPGSETARKSHLVLAWLLGESNDLEQQLKAQLLSNVLLGNSASPLLHALETTDLGQSPSSLCGLEDSNKEMSFMCGLEGSSRDDAVAFEKLVLNVLNKVAQEGVDKQLLLAVLHQLELQQREISGDHFPVGLSHILSGLSAAIHRGDVVASMDVDRVLNKIRTEVEQTGFIENLVKTLLLDNPHRVRLTVYPDKNIAQRRIQAEKAHLAKIKANLTEQQKDKIIEQANALEARQEQIDDEAILPKVGLEDVPTSMNEAKKTILQSGELTLSQYAQGTNGLAYHQIIVDMPDIAQEDRFYLPLFSHCMTELGCDGKSYIETQLIQSSITGGIGAFTSFKSSLEDEQKVLSYFVLSSKSLHRNFEKMISLLKKTLDSIRFDEFAKIKEIISQVAIKREQSIPGNGHHLAMSAAASALSPLNQYQYLTQGLLGIKQMKALNQKIQSDTNGEAVKELCDKFKMIHQALMNSAKQFVLITEQSQMEQQSKQIIDLWCNEKIAAGEKQIDFKTTRESVNYAWMINTQVNFCAKSYPTVTADNEDAAALMVLAGFLRNGYLHRAIREQGGAYGGGAVQDNSNACFKFYSYRDPRLKETLDDFNQALVWLKDNNHEQQALEEAILGVVSSMDKPGSPSGEAKKSFQNNLFGRTLEKRQALREKVLAVTIEDLKKIGDKYFSENQASTAVITNNKQSSICEELGLQSFNI
ncbi:MAG: insulinase family protein [Gammaproteobacteria bacterium]|nr:insulinase family protein [Gammaproteobacteria bacterium]